MEPLLILLVIPAIAFMMLRADSLRTAGLDPETREFYRKVLPLVAVSFWILGGVFVFLGVQSFQLAAARFDLALLTLTRIGLGGGLVSLGWKAWQVSRHVEQDNLSLQQLVQRDFETSAARTAAILFILLPLALPSLILMSTVGLIPVIVYGFSAFPRKYTQNQLLWTLALATKNNMELASEVHSFANSITQERQSVRALMFKIAGIVFSLLIPPLLLFFVPMFFRMRSRRKMNEQLFQLSSALYDGVPLAEALYHQPNLLPSEVVGAIEAAEAQGDVGTVLTNIAIEHSRQLEQRGMAGRIAENGAAYAAILIVVLFNIAGFIMYWIVPKFKAIFNDFGVELPALTQTWITVCDWFVNYWYLAGPFMSLPLLPFAFGGIVMLDDSRWIPSFLLRIFPRIEAPTLLRRLGYVASCHQQLQPSLDSLARATPDFGRSRRYERLESRIDQGDSLGQALSAEGFITPRESYAIDHSTELGHLGWALRTLANSIQQRRTDRSRWIMEFMRPLVVIGLALLVASFCIAMFLPLVKLLNDLS